MQAHIQLVECDAHVSFAKEHLEALCNGHIEVIDGRTRLCEEHG